MPRVLDGMHFKSFICGSSSLAHNPNWMKYRADFQHVRIGPTMFVYISQRLSTWTSERARARILGLQHSRFDLKASARHPRNDSSVSPRPEHGSTCRFVDRFFTATTLALGSMCLNAVADDTETVSCARRSILDFHMLGNTRKLCNELFDNRFFGSVKRLAARRFGDVEMGREVGQ